MYLISCSGCQLARKKGAIARGAGVDGEDGRLQNNRTTKTPIIKNVKYGRRWDEPLLPPPRSAANPLVSVWDGALRWGDSDMVIEGATNPIRWDAGAKVLRPLEILVSYQPRRMIKTSQIQTLPTHPTSNTGNHLPIKIISSPAFHPDPSA